MSEGTRTKKQPHYKRQRSLLLCDICLVLQHVYAHPFGYFEVFPASFHTKTAQIQSNMSELQLVEVMDG